MSRGLTKKQKGFVKDYIKTGNGTLSALKNYDTKDENVAGAIASENLRKPKIEEVIKSIADSIPDEDLLKVHLEGLKATRSQGVGGMVLNTEKGEFGHTNIEVPDYAVRHKYLDTAYKIKDIYTPEKHDITSQGKAIVQNIIVLKDFDATDSK